MTREVNPLAHQAGGHPIGQGGLVHEVSRSGCDHGRLAASEKLPDCILRSWTKGVRKRYNNPTSTELRPVSDVWLEYSLSSRKAASATTLALNAGVCMRRADFLIIENSFMPNRFQSRFMPRVST